MFDFFVRNCFFNRLIGFGQLKKNIRANSIYDHVISAHISHSIHIFFSFYIQILSVVPDVYT